MMKRNRPIQHFRRLKSGKRIVINRGVKPKRKRRSQIYLKPKLPKGVEINFGDHDMEAVNMFTLNNPDYRDKIFIGDKAFIGADFSKDSNIKDVAGSVAHEEMHNALGKMFGPEASEKYDNITIESLGIPDDEFVHPAQKIQYPSEARKKRQLISFYMGNKDAVKDIMAADFPPKRKRSMALSEKHVGIPLYDYPDSFGKTLKRKELVYMSPDEYLDKAGRSFLSDKHAETLRSDVANPDVEVDAPFLQYEGDKVVAQEGRHRALISKKLGKSKIPVFIIEE